MLKQHLAASLVGTAFVATPVAAQTKSTPASPPTSDTRSNTSGQFVTQLSPGQWRASKLVGVDVYGADKAKIGDVREVLVNRDGAAEAVVIGVGGFLGIGEKDVAVHVGTLDSSGPARNGRASPDPAENNSGSTGGRDSA